MKDIDPVDSVLEELRIATEDAAPPDRFDDLVWSRIDRRARRRSPWLPLVPAAAAACVSVCVAWRSDARLAERVLEQIDNVAMEAP